MEFITTELVILSLIFAFGRTCFDILQQDDAISVILKVGSELFGQSFDIPQLYLPPNYQSSLFNTADSMSGFHFYNIQGFVLVADIQDCLKFCIIHEPCRTINYVRDANLCVSLGSKAIDQYILWKDDRFDMRHAYFIEGSKANPPILAPIPTDFRPGIPYIPTNVYSRHRIIGGTEPIPHSFPWIVKITICKGEQVCDVCGGSIIPPKVLNDDRAKMSDMVVTAAHCVINGGFLTAPDSVKLMVSHHRDGMMEAFEKEIVARRIVTSKGYDSINVLQDIALIQMAEYVEYNRHVLSIRLPSKPHPSYSDKCVTVGWGKTSDANQFANNVLQQVVLTVFPNDKCDKYWDGTIYFETTNRLCAGSMDGKGTCGGDSGGPLFCPEQINENEIAFVLYGLTSFGHLQSCSYKPNAFTRVYSYLTWMKNVSAIIDTMPDHSHIEF